MNLHVLEGPNFSGRTRRLRRWVGLPDELGEESQATQNAYIGPDAGDALSGIAPTVAAELELMASDRDAALAAKRAMEELGFGYCLEQNPFVLSGGEQVVTAVVAAIARRPRRLAIDGSFEQLSDETRTNLLTYLGIADGDLLISDNRLSEWYSGQTEKLEAATDAPLMQQNEPLKTHREPCEIELIDLCHSYVKGRAVFNKLNMKFEAGQHYVLSGPNGSGKSTLSKILCGLIKPSAGEIRINGKPVKPWLTPGKWVSYHFQNPDFQIFATSVREQLANSASDASWGKYFGLEAFLDSHPFDLPFTLRKRVTMAAAFARCSGATILDEPTLSQDDFSSRLAAVKTGTTISISHSRMLADRPIIRLDGRG